MANALTVSIPLVKGQQVARVKNPNGSETFRFRAYLKDVPDNIPCSPNARNAKVTARTCKTMLKTLNTEPEQFVTNNSGIILSASEADISRNCANIIFPCDPMYGNCDGGHTYATIKKWNRDTVGRVSDEFRNKAQVDIEVIVGLRDRDSVNRIVRARNDKMAVKRIDLVSIDSDTDRIKEFLSTMPFYHNIIFKTGQLGKTVKLTHVLSIMSMFGRQCVHPDEESGIALNLASGKRDRLALHIERETRNILLNMDFYEESYEFFEKLFLLTEQFERDCADDAYIPAEMRGKRARNALIETTDYETVNDARYAQRYYLPEKVSLACLCVFMPLIIAHGTLDSDGEVHTVNRMEWIPDVEEVYRKHKRAIFKALNKIVFPTADIRYAVKNGAFVNTIDTQGIFNAVVRICKKEISAARLNSTFAE